MFNQLMYTLNGNVNFTGNSKVLLANSSTFTLVNHSGYDTSKTLISGLTINGQRGYNEGKVVYAFFMNEPKAQIMMERKGDEQNKESLETEPEEYFQEEIKEENNAEG